MKEISAKSGACDQRVNREAAECMSACRPFRRKKPNIVRALFQTRRTEAQNVTGSDVSNQI